MRLRLLPVAVSTLASLVCFVACGDNAADPPAAGAGGSNVATAGASGANASGDGAGNAGAAGSSGAGGGAGTNGNEPGSPTTSAMCGGIPILGQQGKATTAACNACVETNCCASATTCGANEACIPFRNCLGDCTDAACSKQCNDSFAGGIAASDAFVGCRSQKCGAICQNLACLGGPLPMVPTAPTYAITLQTVDFLSGKVVPNMTIKQCKRADAACATPVATAITTAAGDASFAAVPVDANGLADYFEITEAAYQAQLFFATGTSAAPLTDGARIAVSTLSTSTWKLLVDAAQVTLDATRGHVSFFTNSCSAQGIGMSVSGTTSDAVTRTVYLESGFPSASATATDGGGAGALLNLPPGEMTLTSTLASTGQAIGKAHVHTRIGYVTTTNLRPGAE